MKKIMVVISIMTGFLLAQSVTFSGVPSQVKAGEEFTITIQSSNSSDAGLRTFDLIVDGNKVPNPQDYMEPYQFNFSNGTATVTLKVFKASGDIKLGVFGYTGESSSFTVNPADFKKIQIIFPGETPDPGNIHQGKKGEPDETTAGVPVTVTLRATDDYWNLISSQNAKVYFSSSDPYARFPQGTSITGEKDVSIIMRRKGEHTVSVSPSEGGSATDQSTIKVKDAGFTRLLIIAPGEKHEPGDTLVSFAGGRYPGKSGKYDEPKAGEPYPLTILAVDSCWNQVDSVDQTYTVYFFSDHPEAIIYNDSTAKFYGTKTSVVDSIIFKDLGVYNLQPLVKEGTQSGYTWQILVKVTNFVIELTRKYEGQYLVVNEKDSIIGKLFKPVGGDSLEPANNIPVKFIIEEGADNATLIPLGFSDTSGVSEYAATTNTVGEAYVFFKAFKEGNYTIRFQTEDGTADTSIVIQVIKPSYNIKAYPSPMNKGDVAKIEYILENEAENVTILITDMYGNKVLKEVRKGAEDVSVGRKIYEWDGYNSAGSRVASGVYIIMVKIEYEDRAPEIRKTHLLILW